MLYAFGFEQIGVVVGDLYFLDPNPNAGQDGAEHGVRLELRWLERAELKGSIYSAQPIVVDRPIWRVDLLESVDGEPGSFDRTHHHPRFKEWDPTRRAFVEELSAEPLVWLAARLADPESILRDANVDPDQVNGTDLTDLAAAADEIVAAAGRLLERVRAGELGQAPGDDLVSARAGWL